MMSSVAWSRPGRSWVIDPILRWWRIWKPLRVRAFHTRHCGSWPLGRKIKALFRPYPVAIRFPGIRRTDAYSIWVRGLMATIFVSLLFDVRDVFLYFTG